MVLYKTIKINQITMPYFDGKKGQWHLHVLSQPMGSLNGQAREISIICIITPGSGGGE
jgi:hypothetical protein